MRCDVERQDPEGRTLRRASTMTARKFLPNMRIEKAFGHDCKPDGFDLFIDGEWANRFPLRRDAKRAALELQLEVAEQHYAETKSLRDYKRVARLLNDLHAMDAQS